MSRQNAVTDLLSKARAAAQKGDYAASFFNLGSALALCDKFDEAAEAVARPRRMARTVEGGHWGRADTFIRFGKFGEAEAKSRHAFVLKPTLVPALNNLSRLMFEKGDALQALELSLRSLASAK